MFAGKTEKLEEPHKGFLFCFLKILFIHERETHREKERGRDIGRDRSRLHAGSSRWDSILGPRGHALS